MSYLQFRMGEINPWSGEAAYDEKKKVITILSGVSLGPDANPPSSNPQVNDTERRDRHSK